MGVCQQIPDDGNVRQCMSLSELNGKCLVRSHPVFAVISALYEDQVFKRCFIRIWIRSKVLSSINNWKVGSLCSSPLDWRERETWESCLVKCRVLSTSNSRWSYYCQKREERKVEPFDFSLEEGNWILLYLIVPLSSVKYNSRKQKQWTSSPTQRSNTPRDCQRLSR